MFPVGDIDTSRVWGGMNTEILLSRGETVTSFESPAAARVKVDWPQANVLQVSIPTGYKSSDFVESFKDVLHPDLLNHLGSTWPTEAELKVVGKPVSVPSWGELQIAVVAKKAPRVQPEVELDRPRITIQMGKRVDEFSVDCEKHLNPALFQHVIRLWSDPDYCRTVLPIGRNLLIRGCA